LGGGFIGGTEEELEDEFDEGVGFAGLKSAKARFKTYAGWTVDAGDVLCGEAEPDGLFLAIVEVLAEPSDSTGRRIIL
jgi:hypothetical protein